MAPFPGSGDEFENGSFFCCAPVSAVCYFLKTYFSIFLKFAPLSANTAVLGGSFLALGLFWGPGGLWAPNMIPLKIFTTLSEYCFLRRRGASRLDGLLICENSFFHTFLTFAPLSANTAFFGGSVFVLGLLVCPRGQLGPNQP